MGGGLLETGTYLRSQINPQKVWQSLLTNTIYNLLRRIIKGGEWGGLINFLPLKRGGGLLEGGGLFERGA